MKLISNKIPKISIVFLSLISFIGAIVYKLYALNNLGVIITLIFAIFLSFIIIKYDSNKTNLIEKNKNYQNKKTFFLFFLAYITFFLFTFSILVTSQTSNAIISPWQVIPKHFFAFYAILTIILLIIIYNLHQFKKSILFLLSLHYFLSFSIALFVYKIGYGFDPFIHQETINLILKQGSVDPKPFYYLGQYSIEVIFSKIFHIPIVWLDKLLVPVLASISLPYFSFKVFTKIFNDHKKIFFVILLFLIFPFSFFVVTTPQNLSYLFLLFALLFGLTCSTISDLIMIYFFSLAALITQPIAGIPALLFSILLTIYHSDKKLITKYFYYTLTYILFIISLPLAFFITEKTNGSSPDINNSINFISLFFKKPFFANSENIILNTVYFIGANFYFIVLLLIIIGVIIAFKHKNECKVYSIYFFSSISLVISLFIVKFLPFNYLIYYEQQDYLKRILLVSIFFLSPFIITAMFGILESLCKKNKYIILIFSILFIVLITTNLYISYPRFDNYFNSRGYSVSKTDIDAVRWIEENTNKNYIVLANQQVSVGALREFGFSKYYKENIFYYPIPTGGPLYKYYLDMVYKKPSRENMISAMELAGVDKGFFVLNKYWWAYPKILAEAKLEADSWKEFGNGEVTIFSYKK